MAESPDWSAYQGKRILVTGGAGAIGSNLTRRLIEAGAKEIVVLDNLSSGYVWNVPKAPQVRFVKGDILDDEVLKHVFRARPTHVFHLAAHFANQNSVDHPEKDLDVNGKGTLKLLQLAHLGNVERFVYASSGCGVYGLDSKMPFEEHDISISLHTPYQVTKLLGELYTNYFHNMYGLPIVNARFFNNYGPGEVPGRYRNVIPNFMFWAMQGKALPITGDGSETRDFTYVDDITYGLMAMGTVEKAVGEAINLGSAHETPIARVAEIINDLTGNKAGIRYAPRRDWDKKTHLLSSIEKARRILGYNPQTRFEHGMKQVHHWFVENWNEIERSAEFY